MKTIKMPAPQWRTVLQWMAAIIDTHSKVSFNRKNINGQIPAEGVYDVLEDMASAADAAKKLEEENQRLRTNKLTTTEYNTIINALDDYAKLSSYKEEIIELSYKVERIKKQLKNKG